MAETVILPLSEDTGLRILATLQRIERLLSQGAETAEIDEDGYLVLTGASIDEDGYLVTTGTIDEGGYLTY